MTHEVFINITSDETRVALIENKLLQEIYIERHASRALVGNIYKGKITRIVSGIHAAFVEIGLETAGFLPCDENTSFKPGQDILVQVCKEAIGLKGPRLTADITLPSRYLVFTPNQFQIAVSQRVTDLSERERLEKLMTPNKEGGYIFRTSAVSFEKEKILEDKDYLDTTWKKITEDYRTAKTGTLLHEELPLVLRLLRDWIAYDFTRIRVDDQDTFFKIQTLCKSFQDKIEYHDEARPIFDIYSIEEELQKALHRKIHLKSGGYLVIDQTEAMTAIDVNTGSYLDPKNATLKTNLEAAEMIARQIRLRNLGGMIVVDFIDLTERADQEKLLQTLKVYLAKDSVTVQISELSSLGLLQMTRKRTRESLEQIVCRPCPLCYQQGSIKSLTTMRYEIFRGIQRAAHLFSWTGYLVLASQEVIDFISKNESHALTDLQVKLGKRIQFQVESSFTSVQYNVLPLSEG